ncbi:MAG: pyruvate formate lyase family protein [Victivallales bacterium]
MSSRIPELKKQVMERKGSFIRNINPFVQDVAIWKSSGEQMSRVQHRAAFLKSLVEISPVEIPAGWRLAGEHLPTASQSFGFLRKLKANEKKRLSEFNLSKDEIKQVKSAVEQWTSFQMKREFCETGEISPGMEVAKGAWSFEGTIVFWGGGWVENHSIRDYAKVLRIGFGGIKAEVEAELGKSEITDPGFPQKENFLKAAISICDAGILLGKRYSELASGMAQKEKCEVRKKELLKMAETCANVPAKGAGSLFEATQSLWFAHILTCGEDSINANSIGRLDQILYPYYKKDADKGLLSKEEAREIMEELGCKLYLDYDVQAIVLGGLDKKGAHAANELTSIILDATDRLGFIRDISVRLDSKSPDSLIGKCAEMIIKGGGIPFVFNDDCFVKALSDRGISLEDARDYAPIGCIELTIPGKANPHAVSGWINSTKCLELALFGGKDPASGIQIGPKTPDLSEMESYDEFWKCYKKQMEFFSGRMVYFCNRGELQQREFGPLPCWSVLTDDCIKRGRDITNGGAVYNYHSICFLGTANTADSLCAVKKLVFEDKKIKPAALLESLGKNFEGAETLRLLLLKGSPKYGNDCPEVDDIAKEVDEHFIKYMDTFRTPLGGRYFVHLFSFLCNIGFGKTTGATPDGRFSGEALAYSLSAQQGRDEKGITAMLKSLSKLPHDMAAGASAAIVEISPKIFEGIDGVKRMADIIRTLLSMRIGQIQFNVVTVERLKLAQKEPDKYGSISVRVAGFSQMFKLIDRDLQNHIIARTKHEK